MSVRDECSEKSGELEPAAWMAYNNMGGAGLVPYLLKSKAERNTASEDPDVAEEYPKPLYYVTRSEHHLPADGVIDAIDRGTAIAVNEILDGVENEQHRRAIMGLATEIVDVIKDELGVREGTQQSEAEIRGE